MCATISLSGRTEYLLSIEAGYSLYTLCAASGGSYYEWSGADIWAELHAPLAHIDEPAPNAVGHRGGLRRYLQVQGVAVTPEQRLALHRALELLAAEAQVERSPISSIRFRSKRCMRRARTVLPRGPRRPLLLDAEHDCLDENVFQVFELEQFGELGLSGTSLPFYSICFIALLTVCYRVEPRAPIALGEAVELPPRQPWPALSWPDPGVAQDAAQKERGGDFFEDKSVSDVLNSPVRDLIIESCPTKIFLPNPEARDEHIAAAYEALGLSQKQTDVIAHAIPKRQYYYTSPYGRRLFDLALGDVALCFLGAPKADALVAVRALIARDAKTWPAAWLRQRGLAKAADELAKPIPLPAGYPGQHRPLPERTPMFKRLRRPSHSRRLFILCLHDP